MPGRAGAENPDLLYRLLVQGVTDYAIYLLDPEGIVTNWNAGAERAKGYTAEEIVGQHFSRFYSAEDREQGLPARVLEEARSEGRFEGEGWRMRKDGSRFWAHVVIDRIADDHGGLVGYAKITRDLTERHLLEQRSSAHERQFELLVQGVTDYAIYMLNPEGIVTNWNAGAERAKGYKAEEIVGRHFSRFYSAEDREQGLPARVLEQARSEGKFEGEGWRIRKDGSRFWAHVVIDRIADKAGHLVGYAKVTRDLTDRKAHADRIAHLAHHDALTGLPNRIVLQGRLESVLGRSSPDRACAVLFLDLDRFKPVNDALGHAVGDELLRAVAQRIQGVVRDGDLLARLGGDEFVILQEEHAGIQDAAALAERIVHTLSLPFTFKNTSVGIGVSIGVAIAFEDGDQPDLLLRNADLALYRAKSDGKNCYRFYNPQMDAYARQSQELERDLRGALGAQQFVLHYQPIVDLDEGTLAGFEALLRWNCPDRGMVSPAEFLPVAEKLGLMQAIGGWVLKTACREAALWPQAIRVAVNVSPGQLREARFIERVEEILEETGLAADRLELEITETDVLHDIEHAVALLKRLRTLGVRVALDNFGTGYSSLSFLRKLPFTRIKIDRSFIEDYGRSVQATAIVQAITGLCGRLGIEVTAEGVQTEEQAELLRAERSIQAQGYWFGRPEPAGRSREREQEAGSG